ncbi:MAG: amino acid adenylation domain-containing protein [Flavobacteriales bacterium]|nr:Linear gramicidin synthase subunit B [Flavobacteriales bacterium]MCC6576264.1 amino acid adenylation domain-containing protein [Flavobacteriales bacterium]NUQ16184.1 amino acid adenylation domain-containing protein [Flavobacteriales bacterium]
MERSIPVARRIPVDFDPFAGPAVQRAFPTTEAQREVLTASEMGAEASCAYNECVTLELRGALDRAALEQAVQGLVERHEALRATLNASGTRMLIAAPRTLAMPFTDLAALPDAERQQRLEALAHADMTTAFDLRNGPVFRVQLIRTAPDTHLLRLTGHHAVCDGWSLGILMAEVSTLYNAARAGEEPRLPAPGSFCDHNMAALDFARSPEHAAVERYWLELYQGAIPRLDLPTDRPRPARKTYAGHRLDLPLAPDLVRGLKEVATRAGASFVTTLLTTFELLLHRLTGATDLVVGLPAAGQNDLGVKHLVGHCVNLLALRSRIDPERPFLEHLKARRTGVLDAFDHQRYTFGTLLRMLNVPREPGRIPLCPVVFNIDMNMDDGVAFQGLQHRFHSEPRAFENFELFLNATGNEGRLTLEWSYNTDLFDEATVRGWMDRLEMLVRRIAAAPTATIAELTGDAAPGTPPTMPEPGWHGRATTYPATDVASLFDEVAGTHADRTAVELLDRKLDYRELQRRVHALASALVGLGVKPGDPVGLCMDRGFDMVVAMLAILRAGGCFVPFDPAYPADRLAFMFSDTAVRVMLTQRHLVDALPRHEARCVFPDEVAPGDEVPMPVVPPDAPAYIMYTSGSTGTPKGVVVPHRAIVRLVRAQEFVAFGPDLCWLQLSNISFDASTLEIWGALLNGGRLVLQAQQKPTLAEIGEAIARHKVTSAWFTVGLFNMLVDEQIDHLRGLKHILTGGDVLSVPHVRKALKTLGPGVLINGYGPTENTTFTCCFPIDREADLGEGVPIGFPLHNTTVHVLDEQRRPVPVGRQGELYTGGDGVALGYWQRPDLTAERFLDDPFSGKPGARLYRTGDLVKWRADGSIAFIGRADGQVKVRGFRIELGEVENALNDLPAVKDRVATTWEDAHGAKQLACYVVPAEPGRGSDQDLIEAVRTHLRARLPAYMVPTGLAVLKELPLTANGKVDRRALPPPMPQPGALRAEHVAPRSDLERTLAGLWGQVLQRPDIGVHDDFFDLGGHSLLGIQLLGLTEQRLGRSLPLKALFEAPTIARFAAMLGDGGTDPGWKNLALIQPEGEGVPLFCVHGDEASHFLPKYLGPTRPFYAFFHQGEDGKAIRHTTVEGIATFFLSELKQARPKGPYLLCGYSFGGIVAYEMAQQLVAQGEEVPYLAVIDAYSPTLHGEAIASDQKVYEPIKKTVLRKLVARALRNDGTVPERLRNFHIIDTYDRAALAYVPRPYPGKVTVLKAQDSWGPKEMGWEKLAQGGLEVRLVPGDHYDLIKEPHVGTLANELRITLERSIASRAVAP